MFRSETQLYDYSQCLEFTLMLVYVLLPLQDLPNTAIIATVYIKIIGILETLHYWRNLEMRIV